MKKRQSDPNQPKPIKSEVKENEAKNLLDRVLELPDDPSQHVFSYFNSATLTKVSSQVSKKTAKNEEMKKQAQIRWYNLYRLHFPDNSNDEFDAKIDYKKKLLNPDSLKYQSPRAKTLVRLVKENDLEEIKKQNLEPKEIFSCRDLPNNNFKEKNLLELAIQNRYQSLLDYFYLLVFQQKNIPNEDLLYLIHSMVISNQVEGIKELIRRKIEVNVPLDDKGNRAFFIAAYNGYDKLAALLLKEEKIDVNATFQGGTALFMAAENGRDEVVKCLLQVLGINVNAALPDGRTPLFIAAENGHDIVVKRLLQMPEINVNAAALADGRTPLLIATMKKRPKVVEALLEMKEIDVNAISDIGTALHVALFCQDEEIIALLLNSSKINVNAATRDNGVTPLFIAAEKNLYKVVDMMLGKADHIDIDVKIFEKTLLEVTTDQRIKKLFLIKKLDMHIQTIKKEEKRIGIFDHSEIKATIALKEALTKDVDISSLSKKHPALLKGELGKIYQRAKESLAIKSSNKTCTIS